MKYFELRTRRSYRVACFVVCLLSLISMGGIQTLVTLPAAARSGKVQKLTTGDKQTMLARMIELDRMITELKGRVAANPKDKDLVGQLIHAISEYDDLSAQLGGDRAPAQPDGEAGAGKPNSPGTAPAAPPGCTASTASFTNSTPVAIPDLTTVTSTIVVAGAPIYLLDLDLTTFITHTFAADLDITLTSPAGTVVTITTDNGGGGVNVFNGTVWDDDAGTANPPGPVTDNVFVSGVVETPLVPEEAMGAFIGENPNGTWTITITDDAGGDTGSLNSWALSITTLAAAPIDTLTTVTNSTPVAIPDLTTVTSTIVVAGAPTYLRDLNMTTFITHTFAADLDITLTSPAGTVVTITTDNGGGGVNVFNGTVWDDNAGTANPPGPVTDNVFVSGVVETPLVPEEAMGAFIGENPNGTWTITITDDAGGDTGSLNSWSLNIVTATCGGAGCSLMCPGNITVSNDPNLCSAVVNYPPPTSTGTCGTITCVPPPGFSFPVGTTTVTCTAPPTTTTAVYSSGNLAVAIPDNGTPVFVTINVPDTGTVTDVNARIRLNHTRDADLAIGLSHSAGGNALSNNNGGSGQNYGTGLNDCSGTKTIFDDSAATAISAGTAPFAGSFKPQSALTFHNGSEINGAWDLGIVDSVPMNTGTIGCFELEITRQIAGAMCSFTVTVNDTQAPTITCPPNISAALPSPGTTCTPVTYCPPTVTDNCPGATFVCNPPSGACIPPGTTTVTCTATDASGNMASCSFTVTVFNVCIQDDTNPNKVLLFITSGAQTGQYRFCCNGTTFTGVGTVKQIGSSFTLSHTPPDRRVQGTLNIDGTGTASLQNPPGTTLCTITDKPTIGVHTCICGSPGAGCP